MKLTTNTVIMNYKFFNIFYLREIDLSLTEKNEQLDRYVRYALEEEIHDTLKQLYTELTDSLEQENWNTEYTEKDYYYYECFEAMKKKFGNELQEIREIINQKDPNVRKSNVSITQKLDQLKTTLENAMLVEIDEKYYQTGEKLLSDMDVDIDSLEILKWTSEQMDSFYKCLELKRKELGTRLDIVDIINIMIDLEEERKQKIELEKKNAIMIQRCWRRYWYQPYRWEKDQETNKLFGINRLCDRSVSMLNNAINNQ